eukprot:2786355-Prymnesium_polylepis.1
MLLLVGADVRTCRSRMGGACVGSVRMREQAVHIWNARTLCLCAHAVLAVQKRVHVALYKVIHAQFWTQARAHRTRPRHGSGPGQVSQRLARHVSP